MSNTDSPYMEQLHKQLSGRVSAQESAMFNSFADLLWARTLEEDLASRDPADDAGATLESWRRFANRKAADISIFLSNPISSREGWRSNHSIVIVAAPDMPFMVDSVLMALSHDGIVTHHLNNLVAGVDRTATGDITNIDADPEHHNRELFIYAEVDRLEDDELPQLQAKLEATTTELQAVVDDFPAMKAKVNDIITALQTQPSHLPNEEIEEAVAFLHWLLANHFTFLGCRTFMYADGHIRQSGDALGVHRVRPPATERRMQDQPSRTQQFLQSPTLLSFSKSGTRSRVHRPAYPDYIGIKQFDEHGEVVGEIGLSGLYTSRVYMEHPERIPVVRSKVTSVIQRSGLDPSGFDGKVLAQVLATYPRDELFQIDATDLLETAMVITDIHERRRVRVFHRVDPYGLFITTLVYMPRDLFSTVVRLKLRDLLMRAFDAEDADHDILLSESILVRVQFNLRIRPGQNIDLDRIGLEQQIAQMIGDWHSELNEDLQQHFGEAQGRKLKQVYDNAFSAGYREHFSVRGAVDDIQTMQMLSAETPLSTRLYRNSTDEPTRLRLKLFHLDDALPLSGVVPKLENLGLEVISEHPYIVKRNGVSPVAVHDYELQFDRALDLPSVTADFNDAFVNIWRQEAEDDPFNRLVLKAGLSWRQVSILRAYAQYMKQIRFGFSQLFISTTLNNYAQLAADLVHYFEQRFDPETQPDENTEAAANAVRTRLIDGFEAVQLLNEDRILRRFLELIDATLRSNYFVRDSNRNPRTFLALKLSPENISDMPLPRPKYEIFISAPHFEGVHLRGGPVARGGLRWSDRLEDFRTEVLGLVKAQVVKNAVIVPTGAKGGFVVKASVSGVDCYQDFIRGLLDVTDNIINGTNTTPQAVVALDGPDPYLVVAADKGTATFSDTANAIAAEYNFWLGDGFASGGSFGYDHKKMGITARGAWISVQRHFAENNIDIQQDPVTVLGIGDMAGDVFGNGMLLSKSILLVAAFNHQHIFLDPDPDPASSFAERERLFALPKSSWTDYDTALISAGGGVFSRSQKSLQLSSQVRQRFGIDANQLAPDELITQLLKSQVQLIWNGGVGTFVKSSAESHEQAGDRSNDHLRVDASELRCTVFGEGGNLGLTQLARIEFSLAGGRVNTDFIDNSAGVDCSDHEVNIKIALNAAVANEDLTRKQRNKLLEGMTDEVAALVLLNNYNQAQSLSLAARHAASHHTEYQRLIALLTHHAGLNRALEFLPNDEELAERYTSGQSFTRPELAVLLAYAKIHIKNQLIGGNTCNEPLLSKRMFTTFPQAMTGIDNVDVAHHPLAQEITATQLANEMVDRMGISYTAHLTELTNASTPEIAIAYAVVAECFNFDSWFEDIRLATTVDAQTKLALLGEIARLGRRASSWVIRRLQSGEAADQLVSRLKDPLQALMAARDGAVGERGSAWKKSVESLVNAGLESTLARNTAHAADLAGLLPILDTAQQRHCDQQALTHLNVVVGHELQIDWLAAQIAALPSSTHWQAVQRESLLETLHKHQVTLSANVLAAANGDLSTWLRDHLRFADMWSEIVNEARTTNQPDASVYTVVTNKLGELVAS